ncbi:MAG TPA: ATP-binding protein [Skermanella sp.]|nr:ATP-binding protein [Skermanella sp.]
MESVRASLRAKLALVLVTSIIAVVGLATTVTMVLVRSPGPFQIMDPIARQIRLISQLAGSGGAAVATGLTFDPVPAAGPISPHLTESLRDALARTGEPLMVVVTRPEHEAHPGRVSDPGPGPAGGPRMTVSIPVSGRGWLLMPLQDLPPPGPPWMLLVGYMVLIAMGATAVALFAAAKMSRPLVMLEQAITSIGPDGNLPTLPESGPDEVRATARALNRLSARLRTAMESRMRLVAAAGHDLRTPMTRLRLRAEFLPDEERDQWLNDLEELDRIADSAIGLVREEAEPGSAEPLPLDRLVPALVDDLAGLGIAVRLGTVEPAWTRAGPLALKRALRNLIINAATHGGGATVEVFLRDEVPTVVISDHGPGIPPELVEQVFEPFFRVDPGRRQQVPGAGLGLAIAREIVVRCGGGIDIRNRDGGGLIQTVTLAPVPLAARAALLDQLTARAALLDQVG